MANTSIKNNPRLSLAMQRTGQWVFSQDVPTDVIVEVGEANFSLHKFMLIAKSNYIRKLILETKEAVLITRINLSDVPGGPEIFEKAAKFCYGVNFEITVHNVAALRCAAEYLQMTDKYCDNNLANRTEDFLTQVAFTSFSGALVVLKSCEDLLPLADDLKIVERCLNVVAGKACVEANFPSRSPPNWWTEELSILDVYFFEKIISSMKLRGAKGLTIATAITTYAEKSLRDLVRDHSGNGTKSIDHEPDKRIEQRELLESIVGLLPPEKTVFPINFMCCLLRSAIFLRAAISCKHELEKRISFILEHVTVDDLLVICLAYDGERLFDLDSVRRIISVFVEKEKSVGVFNGGEYKEVCSTGMLRVAKTVDAFLGEIAAYHELSISKFNGIAYLVPKGARKVDDDLYRAIDIYLKAHSDLDEIEREKVCSVMDPLKLSYEARLHASQNKRLPVQVVLHALYYDQLKIRSGTEDHHKTDAMETRNQLQMDVSLMKENEELRNQLLKMKMYVEDLQKKPSSSVKGSGSSVKGSGSSIKGSNSSVKGSDLSFKGGNNTGKRTTFFSSMSKTLGKLNPFKNGSKDTSMIDDWGVDITKPRKRRFSIS